MTTKLAVTSVKVLDQNEALDFYVNKLGLEVGQPVSGDSGPPGTRCGWCPCP